MTDVLTARHLQQLLSVGEAIASIHHTDELLEMINRTTCDLLEAERSTIFLYDERRNELYSQVANLLEIREIRIPMGRGLVGHVGATGEVLNIADAYKHPRFNPEIDQQTGFQTRSILTVALHNRRQKLVGVCQVLNKRQGPFSDLDVDILRVFSSFIAVALDNAILFSALEKAHRDVLELKELKSKFIVVASHELLTPITVLHGQLSLICGELLFPLSDEQKEAMEVASSQVIRLTRLVRDILNVSELDFRGSKLSMTTIDQGKFFDSIEEEIRPFVQSRRQLLSFHLHADPSTFEGDEGKLRQAVINILMNAIRFTPDGGEISVRTRTISLRKLSNDDKFIEIAVQDTGIGIHTDEFERIFQPFYEISDTLHHSSGTFEFKSGGLGLGLTITRNILERHSGWIEVESEQGRGSTFTLFLPHQQSGQTSVGQENVSS